jgi:hypothetical protein
MDYFEIYKDEVVVVEGRGRNSVMAAARAMFPDDHLVGVGHRPNGSSYGFFVSNAPIALGT